MMASSGQSMPWSTRRTKDIIEGGHAFQVLLVESTPSYTAEGSDGTFAVELRAKQMRTGIEREYGKGKTLEQMFDTKYVQPTSALAQAALGMTRTMMTEFHKVKNKIRTRNQGKIERSETQTTDEGAAVASAMASMLCKAGGIEFAGTPVAPRHCIAVFGRKDEALWVEAMDKEVMKFFDMRIWEIVDTAEISPECSVIGTCFSFKVKCDSEGKLLECEVGLSRNRDRMVKRLRQYPNSA